MADQRQTDVKKWEDKWFKRLSPDAKLLFIWLCDHVDCAGFMEIDVEDVDDDIGWSDPKRVEEAFVTLVKARRGSVRVGKGKEPYPRVIMREGFCWVRNRAKVQCGSTDLRMKVAFERGVIRRFLENQDLFPEPLKAYTVEGTLGYPSLGSVRDYKYKNKDRSIRTKNKEQEGGSGGDEPAQPSPRPDPDQAEIERHRGTDKVFDALIDGGVKISFAAYKATSRLGGDDIDWDKLVDAVVRKSETGQLTSPDGYIASLLRSPDFKLESEQLDEDGHNEAWRDMAQSINDLYSDGKISADGVREMHKQHHEGVDPDLAAYRRGEGELQKTFPMEVAK